MSSTRCCNDCPIPLEGEPVDEVHIRTDALPEFMRDTLDAALSGGAGREDCRQARGQSREMKGAERMAYYRTCPLCGSNNDPGEACDCRDTK